MKKELKEDIIYVGKCFGWLLAVIFLFTGILSHDIAILFVGIMIIVVLGTFRIFEIDKEKHCHKEG